MGRLTAELQCTPGNCSGASNSLQYAYDLAGNLTSSTNGVANPGVQITNTYNPAAHLLTVASTWSDSTHPPTLFKATTSSATACGFSGVPSYDAGNQLQYAQIAIDAQSQAAMTSTRCYDNRMRPTSETDTGLVSTPVPATVTVTVSGAEQSIGGSGTPAQATATISFTDSGAQVLRAQPLFLSNSITLPDGYHVSFVTPVATAIGVANSLAAVLNEPSSPVTAVASGTASAASLVLTSKSTGADENGAITLTLTSPAVKAAPASMSGGAGATYDTGAVTANINGTAVSTAYGQSSTPQTVAAALAAAISGAGAGVTAVVGTSGAITVTANQAGTAGNGISVTLSSASNQPKYFSAASFTGTSGTLSGGAAGSSAPGTIYQYSIPAPSPTTGYAPNGNLLSYSDCVTVGNCITGAWSFNYSSLTSFLAGRRLLVRGAR